MKETLDQPQIRLGIKQLATLRAVSEACMSAVSGRLAAKYLRASMSRVTLPLPYEAHHHVQPKHASAQCHISGSMGNMAGVYYR